MNNVHFMSLSNEWETPADLFAQLDGEFHFTLDPCATPTNAKCQKFYTRTDDGLLQDWRGEIVFMNPPYGREISKWVKKAYESGATVVCLIPARTDTNYWHDYVIKGEIRFLRGRLYFQRANGERGRAPFPSAIVIFRKPTPSPSEIPPATQE